MIQDIAASLGIGEDGQSVAPVLDPKAQTMPDGPGTSELKTNDVVAAATGGMGVNSTTDDANRFTRTQRLGEEILPIPVPGQTRGFMSVAGPTQPTRAKSCYVRIGGMFPDEDERELHIDDLPKGNYYKADATVAETFGAKVFANEEEKQTYIERILKKWNIKFLCKESRFDEHIEERHTFKDDKEEKKVDEKEKETFKKQKTKSDETAAALRKAYEEDKAKMKDKKTRKDFKKGLAKALKNAHTVIDQSWAVVTILYDLDEENLPIKTQWVVILWACFSDDTRARAYISDTLQHERPGIRFYPIRMYKWVSLDVTLTKEFKQKVRGIYRYQEQQDLWDGAHNAKPTARRFREKFNDLEKKAELQKMLKDNQGKSTAELLAMQIEEDDALDVVTRTETETTAAAEQVTEPTATATE